MVRKSRKVYSEEIKRKAVEEFISGSKSAAQLAVELEVTPRLIYRWRDIIQEGEKQARYFELESEGHNPDDIKRIMDLEAELDEYKKKLAEQMMINDLLKKLQPPNYLCSKKSAGSSEITALLNQSRKRVRR